jgi:cell division protein ZapA (FtsZ GTPase activity inhibitor)
MIMNEKKIYKVQIFEEHYTLLSDEAESFVLKIAELVDSTMRDISHRTMITDPKKIAVLSAVCIADKLLNIERDHLKDQQRKIALENFIDQELSILGL